MSGESNQHWCEALYRQESASLLLYGRALGLSVSEAEDVLHDTFVALLKVTAPPDNAKHYSVRAYRNRAVNYKRGLWRRVLREMEAREWFEEPGAVKTDEVAAMHCLAQLPVEQREVIVLKVWHEHTFEDIAELLSISPHTAAGRYRYGVQKLRLCLEKENYDRTGSRKPLAFMDATSALS